MSDDLEKYNRMSAPSILAPSHATEPSSLLNIRIKLLEQEHKQLEERLRERVESLAMQISLAQKFVPLAKYGLSDSLAKAITEEHAALHEYWSDRLLRRQVQMQEEAQMKEIVKNYEKRIMDLRSMLVGKEAEMVYDTFQIRRDNIPKRENLHILNNQVTERAALRKSLEDLKRIRVQVGALEHAVKIRTAKTISSKKGLPQAELSYVSCTNTVEERPSDRLDLAALKKKASNSEREKLMAKVNQLLIDQVNKEEHLKETLKQHKAQWQNASSDHQQLCAKYKALTSERTKAIKPVSTDNLLMELEEQEQIQDNTKISDPFSTKDPNLTSPNFAKPGKRSHTLKDKRRQRSKQN